jgi:hypothetical protein
VLVVHVLLIVIGARGVRLGVLVGKQFGRGAIAEHQLLHR